MLLICDDIGTDYRGELWKLDRLKILFPKFKINCFVITKDIEPWFDDWFFERNEWIEVGVHGYNHDSPPECERIDKERYITKSLKSLSPYLPNKFSFRAPGFQMTATTYPILRKLGFYCIAHQTILQPLKEISSFVQDKIINTHIYDIKEEYHGDFRFISECFSNISR